MYSAFALSVLEKLGRPLHILHSDTIYVSVHGIYEKEEDAICVTYGYSKDHRPDLKPIVLGLGVTPERLPILQGVEDGNKDDKM